MKINSRMQVLIHMQVLKVDSEITVLYKIIITVFFYYQNTPSLLAPLIFCVFLNKHHWSHFFLNSTWRNQKRGRPFSRLKDPLRFSPVFPISATPSNVLHHSSITGLCHVILALQGQQVFSWAIHTYMARRVRYTIFFFFIQNLHVALRGWGLGGSVGP